jgi:hypothetical protein
MERCALLLAADTTIVNLRFGRRAVFLTQRREEAEKIVLVKSTAVFRVRKFRIRFSIYGEVRARSSSSRMGFPFPVPSYPFPSRIFRTRFSFLESADINNVNLNSAVGC